MTIKEIEGVFECGAVTPTFLEECRRDVRKGVQVILQRYERHLQERERLAKMYVYERAAMQRGHLLVAGVDEAGRGPLAGPVSVAAVILPKDFYPRHLNDSKKLSPILREYLFSEITEHAIAYHVEIVDVAVIDRINILEATRMGMYQALKALSPSPDAALIDAVELPQLSISAQSIIKGDAKSASIAAASILAKVTRDRLMAVYDLEYPGYGFAKHKGYGTAEHLAAIQRLGICPLHRRSFQPVRSIMELS